MISFIVIALVCALGLWALSKIPTLDPAIVQFIRVAVLVVLSLLLLNLLLILLFGRGLSGYFHAG